MAFLFSKKNYKKKFKFDKEKGIIDLSSSFQISEILKKIKKFNWSLFSIPGGSNVTIGGCIGNDVHGKDSFRYGNFGESIIEMEVIFANKKSIILNENLPFIRRINIDLNLYCSVINGDIYNVFFLKNDNYNCKE